ncbi:putative gcn1-like translational activator [Vairimorpha apis BRL 01]|uniref:Putative gcn1-like translational activator n=1 Tax=Vairimorpha apis BRL 01 TaxID=1037528 RepID=T0L8J1_9MICR|nr:putative gcn1-like translational activator [Vairimorpha apis BRL 01]
MDNDKLQSLILPCNYSYLLEVSYKNITDYSSLIDVLSTNQNIRSIERLSEIWTVCQDERIIDYLMYCYLIYELRSYCKRLLCDIKDYVGGVKREIIDILII